MMQMVTASSQRLRFPRMVRLVELAIIAVVIVVIAAHLNAIFLTRLFLVPIVIAIVTATVLATALWSTRISFGVGLVAGSLAFIAVHGWAVAQDTLTFGLPLWGSAQSAWDSLTSGWAVLLSTPIPTDATAEVLGTPTAVAWWATFLSTTAALRLRPGAPMLIPIGTAWFTTVLLSPGASPASARTFMVLTLGVVLLALHATAPDAERDDLGAIGDNNVIITAALQAGVVILIANLAGASVMWFASATIGDEQRLDPRRTFLPEVALEPTLSPLSLVRAQLADARAGAQQEQVLTVVGMDPAPPTGPVYLRTATLDVFDGALWTAGSGFVETGSRLRRTDSDTATTTMQIQLETGDTGAVGRSRFLAVHGNPTQVGGVDVAYDAVANSIIRTGEITDQAVRYDVEALPFVGLGDSRLDALRHDATPPSPSLTARVEDPNLTAVLETFLTSAGVSERPPATPADAIRSIRERLVSPDFSYDLQGTRGHSVAAVNRYLNPELPTFGRGTPEQAASAATLLIRQMGIAARVAVGYRLDIGPDSSPSATIPVFTADAYAWTEALFEDIGWVTIDPFAPREATPLVIPTPTPVGVLAEGAEPVEQVDLPIPAATFVPPVQPGGVSAGDRRALTLLASLGVLALAALPTLVRLIRRKRRQSRSDPRLRALGAWEEIEAALVDRGLRLHPAMVETDIAAIAEQRSLVEPESGIVAAARLARDVRWAPTAPSAATADAAWALTEDVVASLSTESLFDKIRRSLAPRSLRQTRSARTGWTGSELADGASAAWEIDPIVVDLRDSADVLKPDGVLHHGEVVEPQP